MAKDTTPRYNLFDRRVVERNIKKGEVSREEYEKFVSSLPDVAENAELVSARLGEDLSAMEDSDEDEG